MNLNWFKSLNDNDVNYRELSAWGELAILVGLVSYYVANLLELQNNGLLNTTSHGSLLSLIVLSAISMNIIFHIILAIAKRFEAEQPDDERDNQFKYKSAYITQFVTYLWIIGLMSQIYLWQLLGNNDWFIWSELDWSHNLLFLLFSGLCLSTLVNNLTLAVQYRRS